MSATHLGGVAEVYVSTIDNQLITSKAYKLNILLSISIQCHVIEHASEFIHEISAHPFLKAWSTSKLRVRLLFESRCIVCIHQVEILWFCRIMILEKCILIILG